MREWGRRAVLAACVGGLFVHGCTCGTQQALAQQARRPQAVWTPTPSALVRAHVVRIEPTEILHQGETSAPAGPNRYGIELQEADGSEGVEVTAQWGGAGVALVPGTLQEATLAKGCFMVPGTTTASLTAAIACPTGMAGTGNVLTFQLTKSPSFVRLSRCAINEQPSHCRLIQ